MIFCVKHQCLIVHNPMSKTPPLLDFRAFSDTRIGVRECIDDSVYRKETAVSSYGGTIPVLGDPHMLPVLPTCGAAIECDPSLAAIAGRGEKIAAGDHRPESRGVRITHLASVARIVVAFRRDPLGPPWVAQRRLRGLTCGAP